MLALQMISLEILGCVSWKRIRGFQQIQGVQGTGRKPNMKEDKGIEN